MMEGYNNVYEGHAVIGDYDSRWFYEIIPQFKTTFYESLSVQAEPESDILKLLSKLAADSCQGP